METRIWIKVPFIPENTSTIHLRYGNLSLTSQSDPQKTFYYFDSFEDGTIPLFYELSEGDGITITETDGKFHVFGTTDSSTRYDTFGFSFMTWDTQAFRLPMEDYIIDSELTVISGTDSFKGIFGSGNLFLFNEPYGDPFGKDIGYWNVDSWSIIGKSRINTVLLENKKISLSCEKNENQTILRFFEDEDFSQPLAERSLENPSIGHFEYGPDSVADFDVTFDNIKIRSFAYPTPLVSSGAKIYGVKIVDQVCENIQVFNESTMHCHLNDAISGIVDIIITNPDGETCVFELGN